MKLILFMLMLKAGAVPKPASYEIALDLTLNDRHVGATTLKLKANQTGTFKHKFPDGEAFVSVTPSDKAGPYPVPPVLLKYVVGTLLPNGVRRVISQPSVVTFADRKASTIVTDKKGAKLLALEATVHRTNN